MRNGKHAATEIPAAIKLEECWELVETSEKTGRYCCMMENVNYMREEMAILSMVRKGLFGELLHAEGADEHDTRYLKISDGGDGIWVGEHFATRNGNLYGIGRINFIEKKQLFNRADRSPPVSCCRLTTLSTNASHAKLNGDVILMPPCA